MNSLPPKNVSINDENWQRMLEASEGQRETVIEDRRTDGDLDFEELDKKRGNVKNERARGGLTDEEFRYYNFLKNRRAIRIKESELEEIKRIMGDKSEEIPKPRPDPRYEGDLPVKKKPR